MARFIYLGEISRPAAVVSYGPTVAIRIPQKDGSIMVVNAVNPVTGFVIGDDIGVDITDERSLRVMLADVRFSQI